MSRCDFAKLFLSESVSPAKSIFAKKPLIDWELIKSALFSNSNNLYADAPRGRDMQITGKGNKSEDFTK